MDRCSVIFLFGILFVGVLLDFRKKDENNSSEIDWTRP